MMQVKTLLICLPVILCLFAVWFGKESPITKSPSIQIPISCRETEDAVHRLSKLLTFSTISNGSKELHVESISQFSGLQSYLVDAYAELWSRVHLEKVGKGELSLLITWNGSSTDLPAALFVSHYDVVQVQDTAKWTYPPFSGAIADGFIWGRGSLDVKFAVIAILEAIRHLLRSGYSPTRTLYFAFGHDEEVGGAYGAAETAALLAERGVQLDVVFDEGGVVFADGLPPLLNRPTAMVGTAEKGYVSADVVLTARGGHASMPLSDNSDAAGQAAAFLSYLKRNPPSSRIQSPFKDLLLAASEGWPSWARSLAPLLTSEPLASMAAKLLSLRCTPELCASLRTTVAVTGIAAGVADNVLPPEVTIHVNIRTLQRDTHEDAVRYLEHAMHSAGVSGSVHITTAIVGQPSAVTDANGRHFQLLKQAIQETWRVDDEPIAVSPCLLTGRTDSANYAHLSRHGTLRFVPLSTTAAGQEIKRVHGVDERVSIDDLRRAVCTYIRTIELFGSDSTV